MTPTDFDVVIVGAGIQGASAAHHLHARGAGRVALIDVGGPANGTSGAGGGFVGAWAAGYAQFWDHNELRLEQYGIGFFRDLAAAGAHFGMRADGNLFVATTDEGVERWVEPVLSHPLAPEGVRALSGQQTSDITGGMLSADAVLLSVLHPDGIQISAPAATRVLVEQVRGAGVSVLANTLVTGVHVVDGRAGGVQTNDGVLTAGQVVVAAGAWTADLVARVGVDLPVARIVASRVVSAPSGVHATSPTIMVPDHYGLWIREHHGGLTWGNGDGYAPLVDVGGELEVGQPRFPQLIDALLDRMAAPMARLVPQHDTSVERWLQGVPCMTVDRRFLVGETPEVPGLFVMAGDNEAGVTHGPGLGRLLADLVLDGGTSWVDASRYAPDRFAGLGLRTERQVLDAMVVRR